MALSQLANFLALDGAVDPDEAKFLNAAKLNSGSWIRTGRNGRIYSVASVLKTTRRANRSADPRPSRAPLTTIRLWIHIGSKEAGPRVAAIISMVETCRRFKIPVRDYLGSVLPGLGDFPVGRIAELTPATWATRN